MLKDPARIGSIIDARGVRPCYQGGIAYIINDRNVLGIKSELLIQWKVQDTYTHMGG